MIDDNAWFLRRQHKFVVQSTQVVRDRPQKGRTEVRMNADGRRDKQLVVEVEVDLL